MLSLLTAVALAGTPAGPPEPPSGLTWRAVDRRSVVVYDIGATSAAIGLGLTFAGIATESAPLTVTGLLLEAPGAPIMAASGLRSARALRGQGGTTHVIAGYTSWALWAAGLGMWVRAEVEARSTSPDMDVVTLSRFAGGGLHLAAYSAAGMQGFANVNSRRELPPAELKLGIIPTTSPPGLAVVLH